MVEVTIPFSRRKNPAMAKSFNAVNHLYSLLQEMASAVDSIIPAGTKKAMSNTGTPVDKRFAYLMNATSVPERQVMFVYAQNRLITLEQKLSKMPSAPSPQDLKKYATEFLAMCLLSTGVTANTAGTVSTKHHWLPVCYQRGFITDSAAVRSSLKLKYVDFDTKDGKTVALRKDAYANRLFVHSAHESGKAGFYPQRTELFFSRIEGYYSEARIAEKSNAWVETVLYAFWAVQFIRTPDSLIDGKGGTFAQNRGMFARLFAAVDMFTTPWVKVVDRLENLRFCPLFPHRGRSTPRTGMACVFPVSSTRGVVISEKAVSTDVARRTVQSTQEVMKARARQNSSSLFGY
jgi:hypothetical protein